MARHAIDHRREHRHPCRVCSHQQLLSQLRERAHHRAERQLDAPLVVDESRTDHRRPAIALNLLDEPVDCARWHDSVAVQEEQKCAVTGTDADIGAAREAQIAPRLDQAHIAPSPRRLDAAIVRGVVDDDDLMGRRGSRAVQRLQAALEVGRALKETMMDSSM